LPADVAAVLVDQYLGPLGFLLGFTAEPDQLSGRPVTLTVRATAPDRTLGLRLADQAQPSDGHGRSDGELQLPLETLPRLLTGRLRASDRQRRPGGRAGVAGGPATGVPRLLRPRTDRRRPPAPAGRPPGLRRVPRRELTPSGP
jgi:hypothetical protein